MAVTAAMVAIPPTVVDAEAYGVIVIIVEVSTAIALNVEVPTAIAMVV